MKHCKLLTPAIGAMAIIGLIAPQPAQASSSLLFGQNQSYSAVVRQDGTVIAYGKLFLENQDEQDLTTTKFMAPDGVNLDNLEIYQISLPDRCDEELSKTESDLDTTSEEYPVRHGQDCYALEKRVFGFKEDYYYYYSSDTGLRYQKIEPKQSSSSYTIELPKPIKPKKRGAYLVAYSTKDYTKGLFGSYTLEFKTLKVDTAVENVAVGISVSNDLYTKAGKSTISGDRSEFDNSSISLGSSSAKGIESSSLDRLQSQIGQGGSFNKTGKGLVANETFIVKGSFADAAWKLYLWEIVGGILAVIALIALSIFLIRKANGSNEEVKSTKSEK